MIVSIHQPSYFPWLGLLDKIRKCDVFIVLDQTQLSDSAFQHRNLFLTPDGDKRYLTIPFVKRGYLQRAFRDIEIAAVDWRKKHRSFIENGYQKHPFALEIMPRVDEFLAGEYSLLGDAVIASMRLSCDLFAIPTKIVLQSKLDYDRTLRRSELVATLARAAGATCYLSGTGAKAYLDESLFTGNLSLRYNEFRHPTYFQKGAREFQPGLACLDVLFNLGLQGARELLGGSTFGA
jgi:WbqC-like protein family